MHLDWNFTCWACSLTLKIMAELLLIVFIFYTHYFSKTHRLKMNVAGCIDRMTFGSAGNESENQLNSFFFLLFPCPRGALLSLCRMRRKDSNAANISAPPFSLLKKQGGSEKDLGKERHTQRQARTEGKKGSGTGMFLHHHCHLIFPSIPPPT